MPDKQYVTRRQAVALLNDRGFPISESTLAKLCMPSRNEGPPAAGRFGNRDVYEPEAVLGWARARFRSAARSWAEHEDRASA
jgi:hypothetical protein